MRNRSNPSPGGRRGRGDSSSDTRNEGRPSGNSRGKRDFSSREEKPGKFDPKKITRKGPSSASSAGARVEKDANTGDRKRSTFSTPPYKKTYSASKAGSYLTRKKVDRSPSTSDKIRLNKYIANSGVCSRREADELIKMGLITVNGTVITELGYKVDPGDQVRHEEKVLRAEKPVYILMNKPKGFITTTDDPQERKTVMQMLAGTVKERVYPVGRLDRNTTGLLLLTNDGALADKLMHPSYKAKKIYKVDLDKPLSKSDYEKIMEGVRLEEGKAIVDDLAIVSADKKTVGIEIHIGWNRVIRRIFEALDYSVEKLDRTVYAGLDKKDLPRGNWRFLTPEEIVTLKHLR